MHAQRQHNGVIAVSGRSGREEFDRIWAGIGWPDDEPGYLCVTGLRADGRPHCIWESRGGLWELGEAAVEAKDRFLIDCLWVDARDTVATAYLRNFNGLCFYEALAGAAPEPGLGPQSPAERPHFRGKDIVASIVPVPERITSNFRSALEKVRGTIVNGRLLIHPTNCPRLLYTLRQPLDDLLRSPVTKGLVWVLSALEETGAVAEQGLDAAEPWYETLPRDAR